jgi:RNA methyltransferase, TrmH family
VITIRKLSSLSSTAALRKSARLLQGFEADIFADKPINSIYLSKLIAFISESSELNIEEQILIRKIAPELKDNKIENIKICNNIRHLLLKNLNEEPADWDLFKSINNKTEKTSIRKHVFSMEVYLDDIRSPFNVGSIFRSSESFGVKKIIVSPGTASPLHRRSLRTSMGCTDIIPWETSHCKVLQDRNIFALELKGEPVNQFKFPENGIVIIGSEELGVSPECLKIADQSWGRVSIPMGGAKGSINVSVAFGILIYNWYNHITKTL